MEQHSPASILASQKGKSPKITGDVAQAAKDLGASGGRARAAVLSTERRAEIASIAAEARWSKWRRDQFMRMV